MPAGNVRAFPPQQLDKLAKVAGLLASDQDGEVLAAARAATRILQQHRMSWQDLVLAVACEPAPAAEYDPGPEGDWRADVAACLVQSHMLTGWERDFLRELRRRFHHLSLRQAEILGQIHERVRASGGAS
jgi:hypothetical protein